MTNLLRQWNQGLNDSFFEDFFQGIDPFKGRALSPSFSGAYDLEETDKHFLMTMDIPGVDKKDIFIHVEDNILRIKATRDIEQSEEKDKKKIYGRFYGEFSKAFTLPSNIDGDAIDAHYENGVLKIAVPKKTALLEKRIEIKDSKDGSFWDLISSRSKKEKAVN